MPQQRISLKIIRDVLHHYYGDQCIQRKTAIRLGLSPGTVRNYLRRAAEAGTSWPLPLTHYIVISPETDSVSAWTLHPSRYPEQPESARTVLFSGH